MATILKLAIKNIYPNYQHNTDLIFPVYKLDREQSWKSIIKEKINNNEWINLTHDFVFNFFSLCQYSNWYYLLKQLFFKIK
jgi:hypothetical protein